MRTGVPSVAGVYRVDILGTDHFYVGRSANVRVRWNSHRKAIARGDHQNSFLQRAAKETRDKISAARMGKALSPEHRAAIANTLRGKKRAPYNYVKRGVMNPPAVGDRI